jgi:hypothetical protein
MVKKRTTCADIYQRAKSRVANPDDWQDVVYCAGSLEGRGPKPIIEDGTPATYQQHPPFMSRCPGFLGTHEAHRLKPCQRPTKAVGSLNAALSNSQQVPKHKEAFFKESARLKQT